MALLMMGWGWGMGCSGGCSEQPDDDSAADDDAHDDDSAADDDSADDDTGDDDSAGSPWQEGDQALLAPGTMNNVGIYDLAVCPGLEEVYFTNLHYPAIGVASTIAGHPADSIDHRGLTGGQGLIFPFIECQSGGTLIVNDRDGGRILRFDAATRQPLGDHQVCPLTGWLQVDEATDDVWVACPADHAVVQLDGSSYTVTRSYDLGAVTPSRFHLTDSRLYVVDEAAAELHVVDRSTGAMAGSWTSAAFPNQAVSVGQDRVYLTDRLSGLAVLDGQEAPAWIDELPVGSDPFGVTRVTPRNRVYVVARQGASVPAGEAYVGEPGIVYAVDPDQGAVVAQAEVGTTPHFAVYKEDSDLLLTACEDSLSIAAIGPDDTTAWISVPQGLTLDDVAVDGITGRTWFPSHLTDQLMVFDWTTEEATPLPVSRWPFSVAIDVGGRRVYTASQQHTTVVVHDADTLEQVDSYDLGRGTHQLPCDPLCTGHPIITDVALDADHTTLYVSHPPTAAVLALDLASGDVAEIGTGAVETPGEGDLVQHMALAVEDGGRVYAYYSLADRLVAIDGEQVQAEAIVDSPVSRPLALDRARDRVLLGPSVMDRDLVEVDHVQGWWLVDHLVGPDLYLAINNTRVGALDPDTLDEVASMPLTDLAVPPFMATATAFSPVLAAPVEDSELVMMINVFEAAVEFVALEP